MNDMPIVKLDNLSCYDPVWTPIECFDLEIKAGEVFALVGESGSGKTTFVNVLAGIIDSHLSGEIFFQGQPITAENRKKQIGFLFEKPTLVPNLSVAENIALLKFPFRRFFPFISWSRVKKMTEQIFQKYNFQIDARQYVAELTPEEKKMVEIARMLIKEPQLMVLHEPTNGLSSETIGKLYSLIEQYKKEGGTVLYVTKQWEEALKIADRISIINDSRIVGTISSDDAKKNPRRLLNMFLGHGSESHKKNDSEDTEVLDAVFKAAEFLTSEYELKDILRFFAEHATRVMSADGCMINLVDEKTNTIIDTVSFQLENNGLSPKLSWDAIKAIMDQNDFYYSNERESDFASLFVEPNGVKTIMCVPVLIRSQVTGIIQIYYNNIFVYSEKEWKYISTLARQAAIAIEDSRLLGRSALLQESHHRIKNNLQSIVSLIILQKNFLEEKMDGVEVENILDDIISRVKSIAAVHDLLSKDELGRSIINLKEIVNKVLTISAFPNMEKEIEIILDLEDIFIPYNKATTIILIINELVANCFEHAFSETLSGTIEISCKKENQGISLVLEDDGVGLPEGFQINNAHSLGLTIVNSIIVNEFQGTIMLSSKETGTKVEVFLPAKNCF